MMQKWNESVAFMHASEGIIQYYLSYSKYHGHDIEMKWNYGIHKTDGIRLLYGFAYFGYGLYCPIKSLLCLPIAW